MNINNLKGTLYDFLGYFAPGLIGIICGTIMVLRINNVFNNYRTLEKIIEDISALEIFILVIMTYIFGHAVSSASSWIIEKRLMEKSDKLKKFVDVKEILDEEHYAIFCMKYKKVFGTQYAQKSIRKIICYVQSKQPSVYETALIFLSFYGMARNLSFVCWLFFLVETYFLIFGQGYFYLWFILGILFVIFVFEYVRFRKYYLDTVFSGFLITE